jgi:hypothetical protein
MFPRGSLVAFALLPALIEAFLPLGQAGPWVGSLARPQAAPRGSTVVKMSFYSNERQK